MTQSNSRLLDEMAKLMTDAAGVAQGVRREAETVFRVQAERFLGEMDLVKRDDFEAVRALAIKAIEENAVLSKRIETLEESAARKPQAKKSSAAGKKSKPAN